MAVALSEVVQCRAITRTCRKRKETSDTKNAAQVTIAQALGIKQPWMRYVASNTAADANESSSKQDDWVIADRRRTW